MVGKEQQIWDQARDCRGVAVNTLKQFAEAYSKADRTRQIAADRADMWACKRLIRWQNIFAPLGYVQVTTTALAGSIGRANSSILKDLENLITDGLVIRDGTKPRPGNGRDLQIWTWIGERK